MSTKFQMWSVNRRDSLKEPEVDAETALSISWSKQGTENKKTGNVRIMQYWRVFAEPLLTWKSNKLSAYACAFLYAGARERGRVHARACLSSKQRVFAMLWRHLWPLRLHHISPIYLTNGAIFGKTLLYIKCVFSFCLQPLSKTLLVLRRI